MSSTIWKTMPKACAVRGERVDLGPVGSSATMPADAAGRGEQRRRLAVDRLAGRRPRCAPRRSVSRSSAIWPSHSRPIVRASSPATSVPSEAAISDARASRKSPARMACEVAPPGVHALDAAAGLGLVHHVVVVQRPEVDELARPRRPARPRRWRRPPRGAGRQPTVHTGPEPLAAGQDQVAGDLGEVGVLGRRTLARRAASTRARSSPSREQGEQRRRGRHDDQATRARGTAARGTLVRPGPAARRVPLRRGRPGRLAPRIRPLTRGGSIVRTLHRPGPPGRRAGPGGSAPPQPQLHRHRAHPARADPRGRGRRRQGPRVPRHLARGRAQPGRGDHRPGRLVAVGPHPLHAARQEGPRAVAARGAAARPQLHRHRAHPARPHP